MGYGVLGGTVLQCSFGMAPSVLNLSLIHIYVMNWV